MILKEQIIDLSVAKSGEKSKGKMALRRVAPGVEKALVGPRFHPEFRSRPRPRPLFSGFLAAAVDRSLARNGQPSREPRARHAAAASRGSRAR